MKPNPKTRIVPPKSRHTKSNEQLIQNNGQPKFRSHHPALDRLLSAEASAGEGHDKATFDRTYDKAYNRESYDKQYTK